MNLKEKFNEWQDSVVLIIGDIIASFHVKASERFVSFPFLSEAGRDVKKKPKSSQINRAKKLSMQNFHIQVSWFSQGSHSFTD